MDPFLGGLITTGISSIFSGLSGQSAADAQNAAMERQYKFNMQDWRYGKQRTKADYRHRRKQWGMDIRNDEAAAGYRDQTNLQDWQYQLKIQDHEYRSQMKQYAKSEQIYGQQLSFNKMAADSAKEAEYRKLTDATNEIAFQNQDIVIKAMAMEGGAATKGQQGRSADKNVQSVFASLGRNQAILAESLLSAKADTSAAMKKIATDKFGADIAAQAARMLRPDRLPQPPKPITTPRTEFLKPRKPKKYDFGPKPIKGAAASAGGAWMDAAGSAIGSISGLLGNSGGGGGSKYAGNHDYTIAWNK